MTETVKDCHYPWTWMMVTADGAVKPCCFASGTLGNLHEASAEEIWNGSIAVELRKFIKANRVHAVCAKAPCKYVQSMQAVVEELPTVTPVADTPEQFDEAWYLEAYSDVAEAVRLGAFASGWQHYRLHGRAERRRPTA